MTDAPDDRALFIEYSQTGSRSLRNRIVERNEVIADRCARRFQGRGESIDDLRQVAFIGLIRAVERFDPSRGVPFAAFAVPTILGEIRRHFRDRAWTVSVPRRVKDLRQQVSTAIEELDQRLGRSPTPSEIGSRIGVDTDTVLDVVAAGHAYRPRSIDIPGWARTGGEDGDVTVLDDRLEAFDAMQRLGERDRTILYWRYFEERTQQEIGDRLGIGQVQVSRLLKSAMNELHELLSPD